MRENYYNNELISSILEAKADKIMADKLRGQGQSEEEVRTAVEAARNKRRFGKDFEGATKERRKTAAEKGRRARGKETPEDIRKRKDKEDEDVKAGLDPKTGQRVRKMTGHQIGGRKRSTKNKLGQGPSKPMNLPEPKSQDRQDEGVERAVRLRRAGHQAASKKESDKVSASRERREEIDPEVMKKGFVKGIEARRAKAAAAKAAEREDSSNLTYNDVLSILLERDKKNKALKDAYIQGLGRQEDATGTPKTPEKEKDLQDRAKKAATHRKKGDPNEVGVVAGTKRGVEAIQRNLGREALRNK